MRKHERDGAVLVHRPGSLFYGAELFVQRDNGIIVRFRFIIFTLALHDGSSAHMYRVNTVSRGRKDGNSVYLFRGAVEINAVFARVVGARIPFLARHDAALNFIVRDFLGILRKTLPRDGARLCIRLHGKIRVGHVEPVDLLDTVHVLLRHHAVRHRGEILIVHVVGRHHTRKHIDDDRNAE